MTEKNEENLVAQKNPLTLAFIGDAYWTLQVREFLINKSGAKTGLLHNQCNEYVNAKSQSEFFQTIKDSLSETEKNIAGRARNAYNNTVPKHCTLAEYKQATAFEAVIGYNYLTQNWARLDNIKQEIFFSQKQSGACANEEG